MVVESIEDECEEQEETMHESLVKQNDALGTGLRRWRRVAWLVILFADAGLLAWGAMAAILPERLPGPGSTPILTAEYESFTGAAWPELAGASPRTAAFVVLLFRMYGVYIVAFGLLAITVAVTAFRQGDGWAWWALLVGNTLAFAAAMTYDWTVSAIGPFELSEYLGLAAIYLALAVTAPFLATARPARWTG